jgi:hypothetical protein
MGGINPLVDRLARVRIDAGDGISAAPLALNAL